MRRGAGFFEGFFWVCPTDPSHFEQAGVSILPTFRISEGKHFRQFTQGYGEGSRAGGISVLRDLQQFEDQAVKIRREEWSEYRLLSGGRLRLKTVRQKMVQVLHENGQPLMDEHGESGMFVKHNSIISSTR